MKKLHIIILSLFFLQTFVKPAFALTEPPVFSCKTPVGDVIADFNEGTHGIAGDSATYTGSDKVYRIDNDHVLQCFCPTDSNEGIQSNWAKLADTSESSISYFQKLGWSYVPNGLAWGLDDAAYIVKNEYYGCHGDAGSATPSDSNSSSNSSSGSVAGTNDGDLGGGQVLGSVLAATGNDRLILFYSILGMLFGYAAYRFARD